MPQTKAKLGTSWGLLFLSSSYLVMPRGSSSKWAPFQSKKHWKRIQSAVPYFHTSFLLLTENPGCTIGNSLGGNDLGPFIRSNSPCKPLRTPARHHRMRKSLCFFSLPWLIYKGFRLSPKSDNTWFHIQALKCELPTSLHPPPLKIPEDIFV